MLLNVNYFPPVSVAIFSQIASDVPPHLTECILIPKFLSLTNSSFQHILLGLAIPCYLILLSVFSADEGLASPIMTKTLLDTSIQSKSYTSDKTYS